MAWLIILWSLIMAALAACGEDDGEGGDPDLFLGLSGVIILGVVLWFVFKAVSRRR